MEVWGGAQWLAGGARHFNFRVITEKPGLSRAMLKFARQAGYVALVDGKAPTIPPVAPPQALVLTQEPRADVERYDALRGGASNWEIPYAS